MPDFTMSFGRPHRPEFLPSAARICPHPGPARVPGPSAQGRSSGVGLGRWEPKQALSAPAVVEVTDRDEESRRVRGPLRFQIASEIDGGGRQSPNGTRCTFRRGTRVAAQR